MPVSMIANLSSQYAQSAIKTHSQSVNTDTLQIATGQRVFSAVQDAAALAVGAGLKIDNAALASARINAGEGMSMLQIADGALSTTGDILVRMKTLAIQASSGNLSNADRAPIQAEYTSLLNELSRLAASTNFNGVNLLNGQPNYSTTQGATNNLGVSAMDIKNSAGGNPVLRYSYDSTTEKMTLTRTDGGTTSTQTLDLTAIMDATAGAGNNLTNGQTLQLDFNQLGVTLTLGTAFNRSTNILPTATASIAGLTGAAFVPAASGLTVDGVAGLTALASGYNTATGALTLPLNTTAGTITLGALPGVSYAVNGGAVGASGAASADFSGANSYVDVYVDSGAGPQCIGRLTSTAAAGAAVASGTLTLSAGKGLSGSTLQVGTTDTQLTYKIGTGIINGQDLLRVSLPPVNADSLSLTGTLLTTAANADAAINALTIAINTVSGARATVGAQQSRLTQVMGSIDIFKENNESARSALVDTDIPSAMSQMATDQAMLQAGIAMLSQTNKVPDMLLSLLRG